METADRIPLICCSGGKLIDEHGTLHYIGGEKIGNMIPKTIGFTWFEKRIQEMMHLPDMNFKIKCSVTLDESTTHVLDVVNDGSLQFIILHSKVIMAYVIQTPTTMMLFPTKSQEELMRSLDIGNPLYNQMGSSIGNSNNNLDNNINLGNSHPTKPEWVSTSEARVADPTVKKSDAGSNKKVTSLVVNERKLDEAAEPASFDRVSTKVRQAIQKARLATKLSQADLAKLINEKAPVVQEYESGKAVLNQNVLAKREKVLGVKLSSKIGK